MNLMWFEVHGVPIPQGSKRIVQTRGRGAHTMLLDENKHALDDWRLAIGKAARTAMGGLAPYDQALHVTAIFTVPKPARRRGLPSSKPDLDKLQRSLGDACSGIVWKDDGRITDWHVIKRYAGEPGGAKEPGVEVTVRDA